MPFEDNVLELPFFTEEECNSIKEYAYNIEKELIDNGYEDFEGKERTLGNVVTTNNYFRYNFFCGTSTICR